MNVKKLNHAVLRVRDLDRSLEFYHDVLGLDTIARAGGLYHLAWEVEEIESLRDALAALQRYGTLSGMSDHGATKSIYGYDLDGNEFEVMWMVPREHWGEFENSAPTRALDLESEIAKWGKNAIRR
jgi:catechol-2,3-dioxygenase